MLSYETRNKLADFLLALSDGERQIEIVRQILCEQKDFEPYSAFKRLDRDKKGSLGTLEIMNFLADNGVFHLEKHIKAFIRRYDQDNDDALSYNEFLYAVLPMDNPNLRTIATQRPNYFVGPTELLPYDVEYALTKVFDREVTFYINLDYQKLALKNRFDYTCLSSFTGIDKFQTGQIDYDNLKSFFRGQAIFPNDDELIAILRRLDRDDDGLVRFDEFEQALHLTDLSTRQSPKRSPSKITVGYSSPSKTVHRSPGRSPSRHSVSPHKIATITHSHLRASPNRRAYSPEKSTNLDRPVSPLRKSMIYSELGRSSRHASPSKYVSPVKRREEEIYTNKLLSSLEKPSTKGIERLSTRSVAFASGEKQSPKKLELSAKKPVRKALQFEDDNIDNLIHTFKQLILLDKDLEVAKQDLSLRPDFNLLDFFRTFDVDGKGAVSCVEIEDGMKKYGVYPNREELYLLVRKFDKDSDGKLRFSDFSDALTPKQNEYSSLLQSREPINGDLIFEINQLFKLETRSQICKVLRLLLENEGSSESLRQKLNKKVGFNTHDAFNYLDLDEDGVINPDELKKGLENHNTFLTEREMKLLIDRLDSNKDGLISYSEFVKELTPKSDKPF